VPKYQVERRRFGLGASWIWRGNFHWITALPVRFRRGPFGRAGPAKIARRATAQDEPSASATALGLLAMTASRTLAGPSGCRWPCSQF